MAAFTTGDTVQHRATGRLMRVSASWQNSETGPLYQCKSGTREHWTSESFPEKDLAHEDGSLPTARPRRIAMRSNLPKREPIMVGDRKPRKRKIDYDRLPALVRNGVSDDDIAAMFGCCSQSVYSARAELGLMRSQTNGRPKKS